MDHDKHIFKSKSPQELAIRFDLPTATGDEPWALTVPVALAPCVGFYARIPEFAQASHLLRYAPVMAGS